LRLLCLEGSKGLFVLVSQLLKDEYSPHSNNAPPSSCHQQPPARWETKLGVRQ
jgi:hypothetical protein